MTKITYCGCDRVPGGKESPAAKFQDGKYGTGQRVHNSCGGKESGGWRCTVCGNIKKKEKEADGDKKEKKK